MTPELIDQVKSHFGEKNQLVKAIEEMSELQKELCKVVLTPNLTIKPTDEVIDELADVEIMCEQLRHIFRISIEVDDRKEFKVDRLMKRILINENP